VALHSTTLGCTLAAEELQDAIAAAFEEALTTGHPDAVRRAEAAEILMSRVYGRPVQPSEEVTPKSDTLREIQDMLRAMTREERKDLMRRLDERQPISI
jgi:hypothetical protein